MLKIGARMGPALFLGLISNRIINTWSHSVHCDVLPDKKSKRSDKFRTQISEETASTKDGFFIGLKFIKRYFVSIVKILVRVWMKFFYHNKILIGSAIFLLLLW